MRSRMLVIIGIRSGNDSRIKSQLSLNNLHSKDI